MSGPLDGVRVLDLTSVVMGPWATQILGDLGADAITIESARGETNRIMGPGPVRGLSDISLNLLRNKRNVSLDLKSPHGRSALLRIAQTCDVFVTNLRPGPLTRLALTFDDLVAARADIVYCHAQGFPTTDPRADDPAYDDVIQAAAGTADIVQRSGSDPALVPTILGDKVSGLVLVYAILAALFHRERTGEGQRVEVPMVDALSSFLLVEHSAGFATTNLGIDGGYRRILTTERGPKRTRDGWIVVFPYLQSHWDDLVDAGGLGELRGDPRLAHAGRNAEPSFGYETLGRVLLSRTTAEWLQYCSTRGIPATSVASIEDLMAALPTEEHPVAGPYRVTTAPVRFSKTPTTLRRHAPLAGQHTREVLREVGYRDDDIDAITNRDARRV